MFWPHLSYIAAISVNRRTSGYPWRGGPVRSDFQWCLLYPVNLRCLARSGRWRQRSSKWLGMLVIMLWTRCQVLISHLHNSWILNHSNTYRRGLLQTKEEKTGFKMTDWVLYSLWWHELIRDQTRPCSQFLNYIAAGAGAELLLLPGDWHTEGGIELCRGWAELG